MVDERIGIVHKKVVEGSRRRLEICYGMEKP